MPRGPASQADEALIAALAAEEVYVSEYQLERWRYYRQMPRAQRHGRGRGKGSVSVYPATALATARLLADEAWQGRSRHFGTLATFAAGSFGRDTYYEESAVREAFVWILERAVKLMNRRQAEDPEAVAKAAVVSSRRTSIYDPSLIHLADPNNPSRKEAKVRTEARRHLRDSRAMRLMLLFEDPGNFDAAYLADAMAGSGWPDDGIKKELIEFEDKYGPIFEEGSPPLFNVMLDHAKEVPFERLCAARDAFLGAGSVNMLLVLCSAIAPSARQFLIDVRQDYPGKLFAEITYSPNSPQQTVAGIVQTSMSEDYLETMSQYAQDMAIKMLPFMMEAQARAIIQTEPESVGEMGMGIFRIAVHARLNHDDPNWHTESFREAMLELIALMKGVGVDMADSNNMVARLWADLYDDEFVNV